MFTATGASAPRATRFPARAGEDTGSAPRDGAGPTGSRLWPARPRDRQDRAKRCLNRWPAAPRGNIPRPTFSFSFKQIAPGDFVRAQLKDLQMSLYVAVQQNNGCNGDFAGLGPASRYGMGP